MGMGHAAVATRGVYAPGGMLVNPLFSGIPATPRQTPAQPVPLQHAQAHGFAPVGAAPTQVARPRSLRHGSGAVALGSVNVPHRGAVASGSAQVPSSGLVDGTSS